MIRAKNILMSSAILLMSAGCAASSREPILYPNEKLQTAGPAQAQAAVRDCETLADQYTEDKSKYTEIGKSGLVGGAVGAGTGALAGTILGENVGRSTGAGAAVGGVLGVLSGLRSQGEDSPSRQEFVAHCLQRQGYEVAGWR